MKVKEIEYPTDTRKFEVEYRNKIYVCYIPGVFNCLGVSVWERCNNGEDWRDFKLVENFKLALKIEMACRAIM